MPQCDVDRGPKGRIVRVRSNGVADAFFRVGSNSGQKSVGCGQVGDKSHGGCVA
jgi:hypothetical protein